MEKLNEINGVIRTTTYGQTINNFEDLVREVDRAVALYNREKPHIKR